MIDNKRISKIKSAPKNSGKNKMKKINLKRNKKAEEKNHYFTNNSIRKKILYDIYDMVYNKILKKKFTESNSSKNIKPEIELEYNRLENLCNKKSNRKTSELKNYIAEKKRQFQINQNEEKSKNLEKFKKIFHNYQQLEKEIKNINIIKPLEKKNAKQIKTEFANLNEISNGSIENNKFNKNFYFGCIDVKRILSKNIVTNKIKE